MRIKGITVTLLERTQTGETALKEPIYTETEISVPDVLISPTSSADLPTDYHFEAGKAVYTLAIPKEDTHSWENQRVRFWGQEWKVVGIPLQGIEENIPLRWNKKVTVERYE